MCLYDCLLWKSSFPFFTSLKYEVMYMELIYIFERHLVQIGELFLLQ